MRINPTSAVSVLIGVTFNRGYRGTWYCIGTLPSVNLYLIVKFRLPVITIVKLVHYWAIRRRYLGGLLVKIHFKLSLISSVIASLICGIYLSIVTRLGICTKSNGSIPKCFIFRFIKYPIALRLLCVFFRNEPLCKSLGR